MLQQAVAEAASGDAPIQAGAAFHRDRQDLQGGHQLLASPGDEAGGLLNRQGQGGRHGHAGFVEHGGAAPHPP